MTRSGHISNSWIGRGLRIRRFLLKLRVKEKLEVGELKSKVLSVARDVARRLIEARRERNADYAIVVASRVAGFFTEIGSSGALRNGTAASTN